MCWQIVRLILICCVILSDKTVCMLLPPKDKRKVVASTFPAFKLDNMDLKFVTSFKYYLNTLLLTMSMMIKTCRVK